MASSLRTPLALLRAASVRVSLREVRRHRRSPQATARGSKPTPGTRRGQLRSRHELIIELVISEQRHELIERVRGTGRSGVRVLPKFTVAVRELALETALATSAVNESAQARLRAIRLGGSARHVFLGHLVYSRHCSNVGQCEKLIFFEM